MSRSRKRTPVSGITTADSDKEFKVAEHRRARRAEKSAIKAGDDPPDPKEHGNPWASRKDGKTWTGKNDKLTRK